jgi:radical SAM-linked protein
MLLNYKVNFSAFRRPTRYIDHELNSIHKKSGTRFALCFPDVYEIGMSHIGIGILYDLINKLPNASAERVYAPWGDMEGYLRDKGLPLLSLESGEPLANFDIVGFSLQYELSFTSVLNMLDLSRIPLRSIERTSSHPIVIAGGPCTMNPAPIAVFFDAILIGDGEDAVPEIISTISAYKTQGDGARTGLLKELSRIEGLYIPTISTGDIKKRYIIDLNNAPYPCSPIVPYNQIVHDRITIEVSRGCSRGCRFCQAGMTYRPVRERWPEKILSIAEQSIRNTGHDEVSLNSLSIGDYTNLIQLIKLFNHRFRDKKIALSLPSIRVGAINDELIENIKSVRKTGFTIAPEAGTARLRGVINKDFSNEQYEKTLYSIFKGGWLNLKLYFMTGLPTETDVDIEAIPEMVNRALRIGKIAVNRHININVGVSTFVPKPHTPFQWYGQIPYAEIERKKMYLKNALRKKGITFKGHDERMSLLEASISRGSSAMSDLIEEAWRNGARLDAWTEEFDFSRWQRAMDKTGIDIEHTASKTYNVNEPFPWDNIDIGVERDFLKRELRDALKGVNTLDCRLECGSCGLSCESAQFLAKTQPIDTQSYKIMPMKKTLPPIRVRVQFSKTGILRYLSHLELISALNRALRRADVPICYSVGFHPAPRVSFGPPLSVGVAGLKEYLDIEVVPPFDIVRYKEMINLSLPEGFKVNDMFFIENNTPSLSKFISGYKYEISGIDIGLMTQINDRLMDKSLTWVLYNLISYDISDNILKIFLKDTEKYKIKLSSIVKDVFDAELSSFDITRTALYGYIDGWIEPQRIK